MGYHEDARRIKALTDENRLAILVALQRGEKCGCELLEELKISQPTLSHHMRILAGSGLVNCRKDGKWMRYSISAGGVHSFRQMVDSYARCDCEPDPTICCDAARRKRIAFICVHNSCRSQIAEALGKHLLGNKYDFYSAGTQTKPQINQDAVRLMKRLYSIDMELTQYSKTIDKIPAPDVAISMGCDVGCPFIGRPFDDDWGLPDPTGQSDEVFVSVIRQIEAKVRDLDRKLGRD